MWTAVSPLFERGKSQLRVRLERAAALASETVWQNQSKTYNNTLSVARFHKLEYISDWCVHGADRASTPNILLATGVVAEGR